MRSSNITVEEVEGEVSRWRNRRPLGALLDAPGKDVLIDAYLQEVAAATFLSKDRENELGRRLALGGTDTLAKRELVMGNLGLVYCVARKHVGQGVEFLDLIKEGLHGLSLSVHRWEFKQECSFSLCAAWCIRQQIAKAIAF